MGSDFLCACTVGTIQLYISTSYVHSTLSMAGPEAAGDGGENKEAHQKLAFVANESTIKSQRSTPLIWMVGR